MGFFEESYCREKGLKGMKYDCLYNGSCKESIEYYFSKCNDTNFLNVIDYYFYIIDKKLRKIKPEYQCDYDFVGAVDNAIVELNYRFKQHTLDMNL